MLADEGFESFREIAVKKLHAVQNGEEPYDDDNGAFLFISYLWEEFDNPNSTDAEEIPYRAERYKELKEEGRDHNLPLSNKIFGDMLDKGVDPVDIATVILEAKVEAVYAVLSGIDQNIDQMREWGKGYKLYEFETDPETGKERTVGNGEVAARFMERLMEYKPDDYPELPEWAL